MLCEKCGTELRDGAKFCDDCGAPVSSTKADSKELYAIYEEEFNSAKAQVKANKRRRCRNDLIVALISLIICMACYFIAENMNKAFHLGTLFFGLLALTMICNGIRALIYPTRADEQMLMDVNAAYQNAKFNNR